MRDREHTRRISFLELFYDLVYVVLVSEVAAPLGHHPSFETLWHYAFLYVLLCLAWFNGALYHDLHGGDDVRTRLITFAQMATVAAMTVFAGSAFGDHGPQFAASFTAAQTILTVLWWRTGVHDPVHRHFSSRYASAFLGSTLLFAGSVFVGPGARTGLWVAGLGVSMLAPVLVMLTRPTSAEVKAQQERLFETSESAVERFGLLTIIVLGEMIAEVIRGVAAHGDPGPRELATGALGMLIAICVWWVYFDSVSGRQPHARPWSAIAWVNLHLVMTMGILAAGSATLYVVQHAADHVDAFAHWLLVGSLTTALLGAAGLIRTLQLEDAERAIFARGTWALLASAAVLVGLGFVELGSAGLLAASVAALLLPVGYGLTVWIRSRSAAAT